MFAAGSSLASGGLIFDYIGLIIAVLTVVQMVWQWFKPH